MHYLTTISHAVTNDGELVNTRTPGLRDGDYFICEACGSTLLLTTDQEGLRQFVHSLHNNIAIAKAVHCPWLPRERKRTLQHPTVTRNWYCVLCHTRSYGNKQCPTCHEWTCTIVDEITPLPLF